MCYDDDDYKPKQHQYNQLQVFSYYIQLIHQPNSIDNQTFDHFFDQLSLINNKPFVVLAPGPYDIIMKLI